MSRIYFPNIHVLDLSVHNVFVLGVAVTNLLVQHLLVSDAFVPDQFARGVFVLVRVVMPGIVSSTRVGVMLVPTTLGKVFF